MKTNKTYSFDLTKLKPSNKDTKLYLLGKICEKRNIHLARMLSLVSYHQPVNRRVIQGILAEKYHIPYTSQNLNKHLTNLQAHGLLGAVSYSSCKDEDSDFCDKIRKMHSTYLNSSTRKKNWVDWETTKYYFLTDMAHKILPTVLKRVFDIELKV